MKKKEAKWLKEWRLSRELTYPAAGKLLGYHWITLWKMEHGYSPVSKRIMAMMEQMKFE